jgi:hypothetical protein
MSETTVTSSPTVEAGAACSHVWRVVGFTMPATLTYRCRVCGSEREEIAAGSERATRHRERRARQ